MKLNLPLQKQKISHNSHENTVSIHNRSSVGERQSIQLVYDVLV